MLSINSTTPLEWVYFGVLKKLEPIDSKKAVGK